MSKKLEEITAALRDITRWPEFNPAKHTHAVKATYEIMGLPVIKVLPTSGTPSAAYRTFLMLKERHPQCKYIDAMLDFMKERRELYREKHASR